MNQTDKASITELCKATEQKAGRPMRTPKDFEFLRDCIYEQCHKLVSISTLKRIWGYNKYDNTPRTSTLDPIAQYVGFSNWETFLHSIREEMPETTPVQPKSNRRPFFLYWVFPCSFILLLTMAGGLWLWKSKHETKQTLGTAQESTIIPSGKRVLRKGQDCFNSIDEYLPLFGIESRDTAYFRPVPHLHEVYVWGPEFHHPVWHNNGDKDLLMPTITEYWIPLPGEKDYQTKEYIHIYNEKLYYERLVKDEMRITFMKNIVENSYVFLGIYRMDKELSTTEKTIWKRIADQCDLGSLDQIEKLRRNG